MDFRARKMYDLLSPQLWMSPVLELSGVFLSAGQVIHRVYALGTIIANMMLTSNPTKGELASNLSDRLSSLVCAPPPYECCSSSTNKSQQHHGKAVYLKGLNTRLIEINQDSWHGPWKPISPTHHTNDLGQR